MSHLIDQICCNLPDNFWASRSVVAVSGGCDSLALLMAIDQASKASAQQGFQLFVAHFDHQWQADSIKAAQFVEALCRQLKIQCYVQNAKIIIDSQDLAVSGQPPRLGKQGIEATARFLRYEYFRELSEELQAAYLLTGHTRDDQMETVLMRIARGTSISGLAGIGVRRSFTASCELIRPMLNVDRATLQEYLTGLQQPCWEDSSNQDNQLTRNRIRNLVLPWLQEHLSPMFGDSLLKLQQSALDFLSLQDFVLEQFQTALISVRDQQFQLDTAKLTSVPEPVVRQLMVRWWQRANLPLREMSREHWIRLTSLAVRPTAENIAAQQPDWPSQFHFPGPVVAKRSQKILTVQVLSAENC